MNKESKRPFYFYDPDAEETFLELKAENKKFNAVVDTVPFPDSVSAILQDCEGCEYHLTPSDHPWLLCRLSINKRRKYCPLSASTKIKETAPCSSKGKKI